MKYKSIAFIVFLAYAQCLVGQKQFTELVKSAFKADVERWQKEENYQLAYDFNKVYFDDLNKDGQIDAVVDFTTDFFMVEDRGRITHTDLVAVYLQKNAAFELLEDKQKAGKAQLIDLYNQVLDTVKNGFIYLHTELWDGGDAMCCPSLHFPYRYHLQGDSLCGTADSNHINTPTLLAIKAKTQGQKITFVDNLTENQFIGTNISNNWEKNTLLTFYKEEVISPRCDNFEQIQDSLQAAFYFELEGDFRAYTYVLFLSKTINPQKYVGYLTAFVRYTGQIVDSYEFEYPIVFNKDSNSLFWQMSVLMDYDDSKYSSPEPYLMIKSVSEPAGARYEQLILLEREVFVEFK